MTDWLEGKIIERKQWTDGLFSLRFEADIGAFKAGQFVRIGLDIDGERVGRPYSLVNAPHEPLLEIYFNVVKGGPLSPRLAELNAGDTLWVSKGANGFLVLDELPEAKHLWLLATGTGIGPFISILKTEQPWSRFEKVILGHSVGYASELAYRETIKAACAARNGQLEYVPLVTRESVPDALAQRIPVTIESGLLEQRTGVKLTPESSHVMLCGNSTMITDVTELLAKRAMQRHRRREPGHITTEKYH
ncbi:MAG: ferredoxin--NADP reductase [Gammaproteobacteria bacterium]|nr:ferredoxin--NADP reductase [Gammaproteobacteria bacterium]MBU2478209.1 ferredoxin--NADP reductase [Gammaproteobacteria bacterium]